MKYNCGTEVKLGDIVTFSNAWVGVESPGVEVVVTSMLEDGPLNWVRTSNRNGGHSPISFTFIRRGGTAPPTPWLDGDGVFHGTPLFRRQSVGYDQAIECVTLARARANKVVDSYDGNGSPTRMACRALTAMESELRNYFKYLYGNAEK